MALRCRGPARHVVPAGQRLARNRPPEPRRPTQHEKPHAPKPTRGVAASSTVFALSVTHVPVRDSVGRDEATRTVLARGIGVLPSSTQASLGQGRPRCADHISPARCGGRGDECGQLGVVGHREGHVVGASSRSGSPVGLDGEVSVREEPDGERAQPVLLATAVSVQRRASGMVTVIANAPTSTSSSSLITPWCPRHRHRRTAHDRAGGPQAGRRARSTACGCCSRPTGCRTSRAPLTRPAAASASSISFVPRW